MKEYPNLYENIEEANRRLRSTIVAYDGAPYFVAAICNHKPDGIFRMYLEPLQDEGNIIPYELAGGSMGGNGNGIDAFLTASPKGSLVLRKNINSPKFNRFRPFPLGMCNYKNEHGAAAFYLMRQPVRNKEQGLTERMVLSMPVRVGMGEVRQNFRGKLLANPMGEPSIHSRAFVSCVLADHPSLDDVLANLNDPECSNESAAFHRDFAIARGPVGTLFLVYKKDVVGFLPNNDKDRVVVSSLFEHTVEAVAELNLFGNVQVKKVQY